MDNGTRPQITFETEVQRQHPRIRVPASVTLDGDLDAHEYPLQDLSAGGFSFDAPPGSLRVGQRRGATLHFKIKPLGLSLPLRFEVRSHDPDSGRSGCRFDELGQAEAGVLRALIGAVLGGELVVVGDLLATLSRSNLANARPQALHRDAPQSAVARTRALLMTGLIFAAGLAAFSYASYKLYTTVFVVTSSAAKIAAPSFTVAMPRDGTFFSLVPKDGIVRKGDPLGSFQAAMLDLLPSDPGAMNLSPTQLSAMMGETLKGTLASPCDCKVQTQYVADAQYVNRNQPLMDLLPIAAKPYVLARFHFDSIKQLSPGRIVTLKIGGEHGLQRGTIRKLRLLPNSGSPVVEAGGASDLRGLNGGGVVSDVIAEIEPETPLDVALIDHPVEVSLGDPRGTELSVDGLLGLILPLQRAPR